MGTTNQSDQRAQIAPGGSYNGGYVTGNAKISTADATATVIFTSPVVAVGEAITVSVGVIGRKSDATAVAGVGLLSNTFRRQSAGNVTAVGATAGALVEDSAGTPAVTITANTTNQTVEVKVTGIAAETWYWECNWSYLKV